VPQVISSVSDMKEKLKDFIGGLITTAVVGAVFFVPNNNIANIMFLVFFIGGIFGFISILLAPLTKLSTKGFMWEFYIPQVLKIALLFNTAFPFLGYIFSVNLIILLVKNLLSMEHNVKQEIH